MLAVTGGFILILVCLDMGIKRYIESTFKDGEERETIIDKVVFRKVYNKGFAFNKLEQYPEVVKGVSAAAGAGVFLYDVWLFTKRRNYFRKLGMAFLSAGAFSNLYDRLVMGKVTDYIGVRSRNKFFSRLTANLADVYVAVGTIFVTVAEWLRR